MTITASNTNGKLTITKITATLSDETKESLGRDRCSWRCQEDSTKIWPVSFDVHFSGIFESKKEGRLSADIRISALWKKGAKTPTFGSRIGVSLIRDSVGAQLGGWTQQDMVASLVRERIDSSQSQFSTGARTALVETLNEIIKRETASSQAHIDRASAAQNVIQAVIRK